jgi:hypothetical protein
MQEKNARGRFNVKSIETAINPLRLGRYMAAAGYDREKAISIYLWNCELSSAFIFPLHIAEVVCRNAIQKGLRVRFSNPWYEQKAFLQLLDNRQADHLREIIGEERGQHDKKMTDDHVVSSLQFGFWDHLTTKRFDRTLWAYGTKHNFPNAFKELKSIRDVNDMIQRVRRWRNRIAHHRAIFDKDPERKFDETITLIRWCCADTADWTCQLSSVRDVLRRTPI